MEQANGRPNGAGSGGGVGDSSPVVPLWLELTELLFRAHCLSDAAIKALEGNDYATAARMTAEYKAVITQARGIAERMHAQ